MDQILNWVFQNLLYLLFLAIVTLLTILVRRLAEVGKAYLQTKMSKDSFDLLCRYTDSVVRFLEQSPVFKDMVGSEKKEMAILDILKYAEAHNIPVTHELIDRIIESSVQIMNGEKPAPLAEFVGEIE